MPGDEAPTRSQMQEMEQLRRELAEARETLEAIQAGEVDAIVVNQGQGNQVFTLEGAERPYRLFVEEMQLGALTLGQDGAVLYCNRRFGQMVRIGADRVVGTPFGRYLSAAGQVAWQQLWDQGRTARASGELEIQCLDGNRFPAQATVNPIQAPRGPLLAVVVADLTEQKHYERLMIAEQALRDEASRKDHFLAMLGHELRNPLVPIGNAVYLIRKAKHDPKVLEPACAILERQVAHMARLVDDLLDVSRIARGRIILRMEAMDLAETVRQVLEDHRSGLDEKGLALEADLPEGGIRLEADPARITQVVSNLLQNAIKFTDAGGRIRVVLEAGPGDGCRLSVQDSGAGFPPELLPTIFDPFMQGLGTLSQSPDGLGLGLALVKGLVEMHGGTVSAHSEGPGRGAEFTVRLPVSMGGPAAR
jgi:PAS domain S-box-containing protein